MGVRKRNKMAKGKKKKRNWKTIGIILGVAFFIDLLVPDPIVFVDEILLLAGTIFAGVKNMQQQ